MIKKVSETFSLSTLKVTIRYPESDHPVIEITWKTGYDMPTGLLSEGTLPSRALRDLADTIAGDLRDLAERLSIAGR